MLISRRGFTQFTFWHAVAQYEHVLFYDHVRNKEKLLEKTVNLDLSDDISFVSYFDTAFLVTNDADSLAILKLLGLKIFDFNFEVRMKPNKNWIKFDKSKWRDVNPFDIYMFTYNGKTF